MDGELGEDGGLYDGEEVAGEVELGGVDGDLDEGELELGEELDDG